MAFKEVQDLDCETTIALGGVQKKTGKANPTKIEGYFLGSKEVNSPKSKTGKAKIHIFQTVKGNVGVWGKTDLDRKMLNAVPGNMIRVTQNGFVSTPNGEMYKYKVEQDAENTIEVTIATTANSVGNEETEEYSTSSYSSDEEESDLDADEPALDEVPAARATPPRTVAQPNPAKVQALLNKPRKSL